MNKLEKGFTSENKLLRSPNPMKVRFGIKRDASECEGGKNIRRTTGSKDEWRINNSFFNPVFA